MKFTARVLALLTAVLLSLSAAPPPATRHVANNGFDSPTCGATNDPCRSLSRAILNASAGDTILVRPGGYGDLTDNRTFTAPGEEAGGPACIYRGLISVDKPLTIESVGGAEVTLVLGVSAELLVDGIVFGRKGKGFTLNGVHTAAGATGISIGGNRFGAPGRVDIEGTGHTFADNTIEGTSVNLSGSGHQALRNSIRLGGSSGVDVVGANHVIANNLIAHVAFGVLAEAGTTNISVQGNSLVDSSFGVYLVSGASVDITGNNIFGNGVVDAPLNCGIYNRSATTINATNNYWGAPTGPGADPADRACDDLGSSLTTVLFATAEFSITAGGAGGAGNVSPVCSAAVASPATLATANNQFERVVMTGVGDADGDQSRSRSAE